MTIENFIQLNLTLCCVSTPNQGAVARSDHRSYQRGQKSTFRNSWGTFGSIVPNFVFFSQVGFCAGIRCPSIGKALAKLRRNKRSRKDSDQLQCELVDIHVDGPQENDPMITQPLKQIHTNKLAEDEEEEEIQREGLLNGEAENKDTAV